MWVKHNVRFLLCMEGRKMDLEGISARYRSLGSSRNSKNKVLTSQRLRFYEWLNRGAILRSRCTILAAVQRKEKTKKNETAVYYGVSRVSCQKFCFIFSQASGGLCGQSCWIFGIHGLLHAEKCFRFRVGEIASCCRGTYDFTNDLTGMYRLLPLPPPFPCFSTIPRKHSGMPVDAL